MLAMDFDFTGQIKVMTCFFFSPLNCVSNEDDHEGYRNWPEKVSVVCILHDATASRLDVFPCHVWRQPDLPNKSQFLSLSYDFKGKCIQPKIGIFSPIRSSDEEHEANSQREAQP